MTKLCFDTIHKTEKYEENYVYGNVVKGRYKMFYITSKTVTSNQNSFYVNNKVKNKKILHCGNSSKIQLTNRRTIGKIDTSTTHILDRLDSLMGTGTSETKVA